MLIDWFTVVAQVFNFLILVWLLKRFLYKPILDAIDAREQRIAKTLAEADQKKYDAQQERDEFDRKNREFADERNALVNQMKDEVSVKRHELLDNAQQTADALSGKWREALQREQQSFGDEIARRAQDQVFLISRKTLQDLADTSLEECIVKVFTRKLREINGKEQQALAEALTASSEPARLRSAFELPAAQQSSIRQALNETFATDIPVHFEIAPDDIGGIELISNGQKVAWSIDEYLNSMQKSIAELTDYERRIKIKTIKPEEIKGGSIKGEEPEIESESVV